MYYRMRRIIVWIRVGVRVSSRVRCYSDVTERGIMYR